MKKINSSSVFIFAGYILLTSISFAQTPGSLDLSFDADGKVITPLIGSIDYGAYSIAIQPDGKILVAGYNDVGSSADFTVIRYFNDGSLDNSFDSDAMVTTDFGGVNDFAYSIALQADGKIIVGGGSSNFNVDFALARYNYNGSLDTSFDHDGKLTTDFTGADDWCNSIVIQPDGKILVAGQLLNGSDDFEVARYNSNGGLDTTFDNDGKLTTDFGTTGEAGISMVLQPDGKIILAGVSGIPSTLDFAIARYNSDGSLDGTFDTDGKLTTDFGGNQDIGYSVVLQSDSKIVVAGYSFNGVNNNFALARYNNNGSLDTSFDNDGKLTTNMGCTDNRGGLSSVLQSDGKIIVAGYSSNSSISDFALACYNIDGSLDTTFDTDGKVTTDFGISDDIGVSVAVQSDNKIVVAGYSSDGAVYSFALARYISSLNAGVIDFSLDNNSVLIYPNPITQEEKLEYTLTSKEMISISLFDMNGSVVKAFLTNEEQSSGNHVHSLIFPDDLASGSYFLVISTPNGKVSVKLMK